MNYRYLLPDKTAVDDYDTYVDTCVKGILNMISVGQHNECAVEVVMNAYSVDDKLVNIIIKMRNINRVKFYNYDDKYSNHNGNIYVSTCVLMTKCLEKYPPRPRNIAFDVKQAILRIQEFVERG